MKPEILQWYENFKKILKANNIDVNNPYSLGKIVVTDIEPTSLDDLDDIKGYEKKAERLNTMFEPAFLKKNMQDQRPKVDTDNVAEYLYQNVDGNIDEERIEYLYEKSKKGQLAILRDEGFAPNLIYTNPANGNVGIFENKYAFDKKYLRKEEEKQERLDSINELGLDENTYDHLVQEFFAHTDLLGNSWKEMAINNLTFYSQTHSMDESIKITNDAATYGIYTFACQTGSQNQHLYNSQEARKDLHLGSLAKAKVGSPNVSAEEVAFNNSNKGILQGKQFGDFINKMMEKTGTTSVDALMKSGVLKENGERIQSNSEYGFLMSLADEYKTGRDIYFNVKTGNKTDLVPYQYDSVFPPASQSNGESTYIEEMQKLKKELLATDSIMSRDSVEYKALKGAFETFEKAVSKDTYLGINKAKMPEDAHKKFLAAMEAVDKCATTYQSTHQLKSLSTRQKNRLCVITKIHSTFEKAKNKVCPLMNDDTLAEKYVREQALAWRKSKNVKDFNNAMLILTDQNVFKKTVESAKNNPYLKGFLGNPTKSFDKRITLNNMDSKKLFESINKAAQAIKKEQDAKDKQLAESLKTKEQDGFVVVDH